MNSQEPMTIDEFIRKVYPPPAEGEEGHSFLKAWGYKQWIIKEVGKNLKQLRILLRNDYNKYRMALFTDGEGTLEDRLRGLPIVRAKKLLKGFLQPTIAKGWVGVRLWEEDGQPFCWFPAGSQTVFGGSQMRLYDWSEVEDVELLESEEQFMALSDKSRVPYKSWLEGQFVQFHNQDKPLYVKEVKTANHCSGRIMWGEAVVWEATPKKTSNGLKRVGKTKHTIKFTQEMLENARVLWREE